LDQIKNMTPTEQLQAVAKALQGVGNDSDRGAIAMQLLGRSGGELLPLLRAMGSELDVARGQLGSLPEVIDRTNKHLDQIGDNFAAIGEKGKEFMVGLLEKLAPGLADLTDRLANIDAAGFGAKLSEYAKKTVAWITETFKLGEALNNIEVAVKGIASGNFGEGLSLMFMTARDTALNAINNIVAAAGAALETVGSAMGKLFDPSSTTMAFINGSFEMLGAKIASGIFDSIATVLEKLPFMGTAAAAVREAQKEAEKAVEDISNIMYYEADNLKSEWGGIMAEMPKEFADSYRANMEKPLFDMQDRAAETASQMEAVAEATREAAFSAEKFGQALRDAKVNQLAGPVADSPVPDKPDPGIFGMTPEQVAAADEERARNTPGPAPTGGGGGGGGTFTTKPTTALDRLRAAAETDPNARAELMRLQDREARDMARADQMRSLGRFGSAARAQMAAETRAEASASREMQKQFMQSRFGARNVGDAFRNLGQEAFSAGMSLTEVMRRMEIEQQPGESQAEAFQRFVEEQGKTEAERKEEAARGGGPSGAGQSPADPMGEVIGKLEQIIQEITDRLPQNALAA
jgi:hypothetical protein